MLSVLLLGLSAVVGLGPAAASDRDCSDFSSQAEGEMHFFKQVPREFTVTFGIGDPTQSCRSPQRFAAKLNAMKEGLPRWRAPACHRWSESERSSAPRWQPSAQSARAGSPAALC